MQINPLGENLYLMLNISEERFNQILAEIVEVKQNLNNSPSEADLIIATSHIPNTQEEALLLGHFIGKLYGSLESFGMIQAMIRLTHEKSPMGIEHPNSKMRKN